MIAHSHLVSPFWALVWIVAKVVAQSAPVHTNRMAAQSISFLALMVGVSSTSWQEHPSSTPQLFPQSQQDAEFLLLLRRLGCPRQGIFGTAAPPPPVYFARSVKNEH